jgi:serine/threonine protein kinase
VGTPDYVAPEQVLEPGQVDVRADVYGLGCTLFHLLTGRPPFSGGTAEEKIRRHRDEEPADLAQVRPEVPRPLAEVVRRMLAKRPAERYPTPGTVADTLAPFAEPGDCTGQFVLILGAEELTTLDPEEPTAVLNDPDTGPSR